MKFLLLPGLWAIFFLSGLNPALAQMISSNGPANWESLMTDSVKALRNNQLNEAVSLCDQAARLAVGFATNDTRLSRSQTLRAEIYLWEQKNDLAEQTFKQAVASCEHAVGPNDPAVIHPLSSLANFYYFVVARYDQVILLFERILKIVESSPAHSNREVIVWSRNLAAVYQKTGRFDRAEPLFQRAVSVAEQSDPEWLPHELLTAADFYRAWGKFDQAETRARRALSIREKQCGSVDNIDAQLDVAVALDNLGTTWLAANQPDQAEAVCRRSLDLVQKFMDADESDLAPRLTRLADALRLQGKLDQAGPLYRRALAITEKNAGPDSKEAAAIREQYAALSGGAVTNRISQPKPRPEPVQPAPATPGP
jgi:tetratricopeptide (TPR) repeat protein